MECEKGCHPGFCDCFGLTHFSSGLFRSGVVLLETFGVWKGSVCLGESEAMVKTAGDGEVAESLLSLLVSVSSLSKLELVSEVVTRDRKSVV